MKSSHSPSQPCPLCPYTEGTEAPRKGVTELSNEAGYQMSFLQDYGS